MERQPPCKRSGNSYVCNLCLVYVWKSISFTKNSWQFFGRKLVRNGPWRKDLAGDMSRYFFNYYIKFNPKTMSPLFFLIYNNMQLVTSNWGIVSTNFAIGLDWLCQALVVITKPNSTARKCVVKFVSFNYFSLTAKFKRFRSNSGI